MLRRSMFPLVLLGCLLLPCRLSAQATGRIAGQVVAAETGRPLAGARIAVAGTTLATTSGADGRYTLAEIPTGAQNVVVTLIGYAQKTITGVQVPAGSTASTNVSLAAEAVGLEAITVTAARERGSVSRVLDEQRTAVNLTSGISREEIARGPDDDAGEAVQRVSGVTVESGKYVFVRGLGERYTTTELNGARLPSPEPDRRVVPLDLFPAGALEGITVSKTFTPDQEGDFSGAQVNLRTRVFDGEPFTQFSASVGFNDAVSFREGLRAPGVRAREVPALLANSRGGLSNAEMATVLSSLNRSFTPANGTAPPNFSLSGSRGSSFEVGSREIRYLGALSYQSRQEAQPADIRATPQLSGSVVTPLNTYEAETGRESLLSGGVLNLGTDFGDAFRLELNNTYNRSSDNEALRLTGFNEQLTQNIDITRLQFVERTVLSSQLRGTHTVGDRHGLEWRGTFSRTTRDEPDRSELVYAQETDPVSGRQFYAFVGSGLAPSSRSFGELAEYSGSLEGDYTLRFGNEHRPAQLKLGGLYRYTDRNVETSSYNYENVGLSAADRALAPDELFGGRFYDPANLGVRLLPNIFGGAYTAKEDRGAGYAMVDYPLTAGLNLVGGARVEAARISVDALDVSGQLVPARLNDVDILPSIALNWRVSDTDNLRASASQTVSRPEYRELANITYRDYVGSFLVFGYPELHRALIQNYDLRWESYPSGGEVMSVALFAKRFDGPIERVLIPATGAPVLTFRNADQATNYGVELELRRRLGFIAEPLDNLTALANATLVHSNVDFGRSDDIALSATDQNRPLLGQAPYVVNLGLTYETSNNASATVLYNARGRRITEVGLGGIPDAYEQARGTLDFSLEYPLFKDGALRLEGENLLDADTEIKQGELTRVRYRTGRSLSVGVSVRP